MISDYLRGPEGTVHPRPRPLLAEVMSWPRWQNSTFKFTAKQLLCEIIDKLITHKKWNENSLISPTNPGSLRGQPFTVSFAPGFRFALDVSACLRWLWSLHVESSNSYWVIFWSAPEVGGGYRVSKFRHCSFPVFPWCVPKSDWLWARRSQETVAFGGTPPEGPLDLCMTDWTVLNIRSLAL